MPTDQPLATLLRSVAGARIDRGEGAVPIRSIVTRHQEVEPGALFVALRGTRADGHAFLDHAVRRGAAALVVEESSDGIDIPVVHVPDTRSALAALAATWHGAPAARLELVGITGTVGKTSTLTVLEAILAAGEEPVGSIGSLGVRVDGASIERHPYTAPDPLLLHRELASLEARGARCVVMEVTSHALAQQRVAGLRFALGVFTNLLPLEHTEYHGTFRDYVEAKTLFFDHLADGAPVIHNADDRAVRRLVRERPVAPVAVGAARTATVRIEPETVSARGTTLTLNVRRPFPRVAGGEVEPMRIPLRMRLLGRSNLSNAALAATAALSLGSSPDAVREVLAALRPARRRMEVLQRAPFVVLDDTTGHPESISMVFEVVERLAPRRVHAVFAVRGTRGARINRQLGQSLAVWMGRQPGGSLVLTRSEEAVDERNRVTDRELVALAAPLRSAGVSFTVRDRLADAVGDALAAAEDGDAVLLLGAQGMDGGKPCATSILAARRRGARDAP
jgi:UDP-N-acetylmuramoyl-L-alanyl-D-glutamate--2,6-diaminopimelate ligase